MAQTGETHKPVSRKKKAAVKAKGTQKRRRGSKRPAVALPRPDKLTLIIVGVGAALLVALWFLVVTPTSTAATNAATELSEAEATLAKNERRLDQYNSNQTYQGSTLTAVVGPAEAFLPFFEDPEFEPSKVIGAIAADAKSRGLQLGEYKIASGYTDDGGARVLAVTFTDVTGLPGEITGWLDALSEWNPLVTFTTDGAAMTGTVDSEGDSRSMVLTVNVTAWASPDETWSAGGTGGAEVVDIEEGLGGLTGRPAEG